MSDNELPKCPDCGAPMNVNEEREIGRMIRKEEIAMMFEGTPEEYAALPNELGRTVGEWNKTETCTQCHYEAYNGHVTKRGSRD